MGKIEKGLGEIISPCTVGRYKLQATGPKRSMSSTAIGHIGWRVAKDSRVTVRFELAKYLDNTVQVCIQSSRGDTLEEGQTL